MKILSRNSSGRVARAAGSTASSLTRSRASGSCAPWSVARSAGSTSEHRVRAGARRERLSVERPRIGTRRRDVRDRRRRGWRRRGRARDEILRRYYPGLAIAAPRGAEPAVEIASARTGACVARPSPLSGRSHERRHSGRGRASRSRSPGATKASAGSSTTVSQRARAELARTLGVDAPHITMRFHPRRRASSTHPLNRGSRPAAMVGGEIHLLPPAFLRVAGRARAGDSRASWST